MYVTHRPAWLAGTRRRPAAEPHRSHAVLGRFSYLLNPKLTLSQYSRTTGTYHDSRSRSYLVVRSCTFSFHDEGHLVPVLAPRELAIAGE